MVAARASASRGSPFWNLTCGRSVSVHTVVLVSVRDSSSHGWRLLWPTGFMSKSPKPNSEPQNPLSIGSNVLMAKLVAIVSVVIPAEAAAFGAGEHPDARRAPATARVTTDLYIGPIPSR